MALLKGTRHAGCSPVFSQQHGIDLEETFSHVVEPATVRTVLSLSTVSDWPVHQLDIKNAFLNGTLLETVARNLLVLLIPLSRSSTCVASTSHCIDSSKHLEPGSFASRTSYSPLDFLVPCATPLSSFTSQAPMWHISCCMWTTSSSRPPLCTS